jgi:UTP-glucose-1-phosphate uridylyltransferase
MKPTLVILAAGMASRYGSMKQTQGFGPNGETILEYSVYDAIRAGFGKVVFIIREAFAEGFKELLEPKLVGKIETEYVFQELNSFIGDRVLPANRTKPWGTAHAVLCCKNVVNEPFAVINADDFYGRDAFVKAHHFLTTACNNTTYAIVAWSLANTLSENGSVSRGICKVNDAGNLIEIHERTKIYRNEVGAVVYEEEDGVYSLEEDAKTSMNFLCFSPNLFDILEEKFPRFLDAQMHEPKSEFYIPLVAGDFVKEGRGQVKVIGTNGQWFGVTYKEDAPVVAESVQNLVDLGMYPNQLWR